jgi:DNA modification methylase
MEKHKRKDTRLLLHKILEEKELSVGKVGQNTLIHGDCLNVMPYIASGSIDAIITDLPYG